MWNLKGFESVYTRYKKSGLRVKDFCMNECISENKYDYRQKRLKKQQGKASAQPSGFVPVVFHHGQRSRENVVCQGNSLAKNRPVCGGDVIEIVYLNGVIIRLPRETGIQQLYRPCICLPLFS